MKLHLVKKTQVRTQYKVSVKAMPDKPILNDGLGRPCLKMKSKLFNGSAKLDFIGEHLTQVLS